MTSRKLFGLHRPRGFESPSLRDKDHISPLTRVTRINCYNPLNVIFWVSHGHQKKGEITAFDKLNAKLGRVKVRADSKGNLSARFQLPNNGGRKTIGLNCKNTVQVRKDALMICEQIQADLAKGVWERVRPVNATKKTD